MRLTAKVGFEFGSNSDLCRCTGVQAGIESDILLFLRHWRCSCLSHRLEIGVTVEFTNIPFRLKTQVNIPHTRGERENDVLERL
jgi:hypothetical protein